jgi:hypothetical protein
MENINGGDEFMYDFGRLIGKIWKAYCESMEYNQMGRL